MKQQITWCAAKDQPAGLAERLFEHVRATVLAGNGGKHDPAGMSPQVAGEGGPLAEYGLVPDPALERTQSAIEAEDLMGSG